MTALDIPFSKSQCKIFGVTIILLLYLLIYSFLNIYIYINN